MLKKAGDSMNIRFNLRKSLVLIISLFGGCDASDTVKAVDCNSLSTERATSDQKIYQDACVIGHENSQSTDRKW